MVGLWLQSSAAQADRVAGRVVSGPNWKARSLFIILAICLFRAFPNYNFLREPSVSQTWSDAQIKVDHPLADMARLFPPGTHESKLTFRLTVPLLAHSFHLRQAGLLILFGICGVFLLYSVVSISYEITGSRKASAYICLAVGCIWPGLLAFHQLLGGFYDAMALVLLLLAMAAESPAVSAVLVFAAAWTDERALAASLPVFLFAAVRSGRGKLHALYTGKAGAILLAWMAYFGTRLYLGVAHRLVVDSGGIGFGILARNVALIALGIWTALGCAWLLVAYGFLALMLKKRYSVAIAFGCALGSIMGVAFLTLDITRSLAYCLPAVFIGMSAASENESREKLEALAGLCALISFAIPTHFVQDGGVTWLLPFPAQMDSLGTLSAAGLEIPTRAILAHIEIRQGMA